MDSVDYRKCKSPGEWKRIVEKNTDKRVSIVICRAIDECMKKTGWSFPEAYERMVIGGGIINVKDAISEKGRDRISEAIEFASKAHAGQLRKGTSIPYVFHPLRVGELLLEANQPEDIVIAGILHDTLEDTDIKEEDIQNQFGQKVLILVRGCTEPEHDERPWEMRKQHTVEHLKTASVEVATIACADKLDNIRSIVKDYDSLGDKLWTRFNRPKEKQEWYYRSLADAFQGFADRYPSIPLFKEFISEVGHFFA